MTAMSKMKVERHCFTLVCSFISIFRFDKALTKHHWVIVHEFTEAMAVLLASHSTQTAKDCISNGENRI